MFYIPRLQKLIPLFLISHVLAYGDIPSIWLKAKETKLAQFLTHNLQLSLLDYAGSVGVADCFWLDDKHHHWKQLGFSDSDFSPTLGFGIGYRYVFKEMGFKSDWFLGGYIQSRCNIHTLFESGSWILAGEFATQNFQWTLSRYATITKPNCVIKDRMNSSGYSLRLSSYYFDDTNTFWKIYPFAFIARTDPQECERKDPILNGGCGARLAFPYVTLEAKIIWDQVKPAQFLGLRYQIGCQINLSESITEQKNSVTKRAQARPEAHEVSYSKGDCISDSHSDTESMCASSEGFQSTCDARSNFSEEENFFDNSCSEETGPDKGALIGSDSYITAQDYYVKILTQLGNQYGKDEEKIEVACDRLIEILQKKLERFMKNQNPSHKGVVITQKDAFLDQLIDGIIGPVLEEKCVVTEGLPEERYSENRELDWIKVTNALRKRLKIHKEYDQFKKDSAIMQAVRTLTQLENEYERNQEAIEVACDRLIEVLQKRLKFSIQTQKMDREIHAITAREDFLDQLINGITEPTLEDQDAISGVIRKRLLSPEERSHLDWTKLTNKLKKRLKINKEYYQFKSDAYSIRNARQQKIDEITLQFE